MENKAILIYIEITRDKKLAPVVTELASEACKLSQKLENAPIMGILIGDEYDYADICKELSHAGFDTVFVAKDARLKDYSTDLYSKVAVDLTRKLQPAIMLIGATTQGRDLAPRISSRLNTGLTADCTQLDINEKGMLAATRPTFGGNLMATILCKNFPQMASVRPHVFQKSTCPKNKDTKIEFITPEISHVPKRVELINFVAHEILSSVNLVEAEVIVTGGRGMKSADGFKLLQELANVTGGALGASRGAVDMGLASHSIQVGQTGKTVTPKIYIACGVSGAIQHVIGMSSSDKIITINTDPKAPIFEISDWGIVGDAFEIVPKLTELIKAGGGFSTSEDRGSIGVAGEN